MTSTTRYCIQARIPGSTPWQDEGSGDSWDTREDAERAMGRLAHREPRNDFGQPIEYRVVEVIA